MEVVFHCSAKAQKSGKKSSHRILDACDEVQQILRLDPERGLLIPNFENIRKMRVAAPGLNVGKSGGYRLIYTAQEMDDMIRIVLLETYFKGDREDLTKGEYKTLAGTAKAILSNPMMHDWSDPEELQEVDDN